MQILTTENKLYSLNRLPTELTEDLQYTILDNSKPLDPDFYFPSLIFLETFHGPAMVLKIDNSEIAIPLDWSIAVGDSTTASHIEILPLTSLNDRGFNALYFNPISGFRVEFQKIEILDFYNDVKWHCPKLKPGQLLALPLTSKPEPPCIYIAKDMPKSMDVIHLDRLL